MQAVDGPATNTYPMNLSGIDVNLVVALDALLRERSVTRAAKRMGLSQPAMSHTLTRLREVLGDPLLVRVGRQMALTERAEALTGRVAAMVQDLEGLFGMSPAPFEPAESSRAFRLAAPEHVHVLLLPSLHALAAHEAPRVTLHAQLWQEARVVEALRSGEWDVAIGAARPDLPAEVRRAEILRDRFVGMTRLNHPKARVRADMETYLGLSHLAVAPPGGRDPVDELLARRGLSRRIAMTAPCFLVAPHVVATSDLVATLPERLAGAFAATLPLRAFDPPFELAAPEAAMLWHERVHEDPAHRWLRRVVTEASTRVISGGRRRRASGASA